MKSISEHFGIEKRTKLYHLQSDGLCEKLKGILKSFSRMLVNKSKDNWDDQIPMALVAYRTIKQSSTTFSPFQGQIYGGLRGLHKPLKIRRAGFYVLTAKLN